MTDEPRIYPEVHGGDEMSPRLRTALDKLSQALADAEMLPDVEGFTVDGPVIDIGGSRMPKPGSGPIVEQPGGDSWWICIGNKLDKETGDLSCTVMWY